MFVESGGGSPPGRERPGPAAKQGVAIATYYCALGPLLRNGGTILQSVGLADVQICTFP